MTIDSIESGNVQSSIQQNITVGTSVYDITDTVSELSESVYDSSYHRVAGISLFLEVGVYQASKDFSTIQGQNGWYYVEKTSNGYANMTWDATGNYWK